LRFASGQGRGRDDSEAIRWFRRAADLGLAEAQFNLGFMYAAGRGTERNMSEAARWYSLAAEQDLAAAQFNLGTLYATANGVPRDDRLAAEWFRKAADFGLPEAEYNLGAFYEYGVGVRLNGRAAMVWYQRAVEHGYEPAAKKLAELMAKLHVSKVPTTGSPLDDMSLAPSGNPGPPPPPSQRQRHAVPLALPTATTVLPAEVRDQRWVRSLDPRHYTLQILSDRNKRTVKRFIERHFKDNSAAYFPVRRKGKTWYVVIWGDFATRASAKRAIADLPPELRLNKPWVRRIKLVQREMMP